MATIGQALTSPEAGWRRYQDTDPNISYINYNNDWVSVLADGGSAHLVWNLDNSARFNFTGTKLRIISRINNSGSNRVFIRIDNTTFEFSTNGATTINRVLIFEKTNLTNQEHCVEIKNLTTEVFVFDAIDIDSVGSLLSYRELFMKTSLSEMKVGDIIKCRYAAETSGAIGVLSELGRSSLAEIPALSSPTPNGSFYLIHSGYDLDGRMKLVADRNIQHSISWDALNTAGIVSGRAIKYDLSLPVVAAWTMDEISSGANNLTNSATPTYTGTTSLTEGSISFRRFNGTSDHIAYNTSVSPVGQKSIRFKLRTSFVSATKTLVVMCTSDHMATQNGFQIMVTTAGKLFFRVFAGDNNWGYGVTSVKSVNDGQWHDVLITVSKDRTVRIYIDDTTAPDVSAVLGKLETAHSLSLRVGITTSTDTNIVRFSGDLVIPEFYSELADPTSLSEPSIRTITGGSVNDIANRYKGTCTGTEIITEGDKRFRRFSGDSDNKIVFPGTRIPKGKKTIRFKIRTSNINTMDSYPFSSINNFSTGNKGLTFWISTALGEIVFGLWNETGTAINCRASDKDYRDGQWHDIAIQWDGTTAQNAVKIFVDDMSTPKSTATSSVNDSTITYTHDITLGILPVHSGIAARRFIGDISDLEIYSDIIDLSASLTTKRYNAHISLLSGGVSALDKDNDWDKIIVESDLGGKIIPGDNAIWNWNSVYSWTSTSHITNTRRIVRGGATIFTYGDGLTTQIASNICFRPIVSIEQLGFTKFLIKDGIDIKSIINGSIQIVGTAPATKADFEQYGLDNLSSVDFSQFVNPELIVFANMPNIIPKSRLLAVPEDKLVLPKKDIDITNIDRIDSITMSAHEVNTGKVKIIVSPDSGVTWYTYNTETFLFEPIEVTAASVKAQGMSIATFNSLGSTWDDILTGNTARFGYLLSQDAVADTASTDSLTIQFDGIGKWRQVKESDYDVDYISNTKIEVQLYFAGDCKINYSE